MSVHINIGMLPRKGAKEKNKNAKLQTFINSEAQLPELPLDLLLKIFQYLEPLDIIHIARTTKSFRSYLMSRTSIPLWRTVMEQAGGPPCPWFLSYPTYARLSFEEECHVCSGPATEVVWEFRARFCVKCQPTQTTKTIPAILRKIHSIDWSNGIFPALPPSHGRVGKLYARADLQDFAERYTSLLTAEEREGALAERREMTRDIISHARSWRESPIGREEMKRQLEEEITRRMEEDEARKQRITIIQDQLKATIGLPIQLRAV